MSAFMVEDKTINRVVTFVQGKLMRDWPVLAEKFQTMGFGIHDGGFCRKLGRAMFLLNIRGVNARYGEGRAKEFRELDYQFYPELSDCVQTFKSLQCWLYQCMEGDVPNDPVYKLMEEVEATMAE